MSRMTKREPQGNSETLMNYAYGEDDIVKLRYAGSVHGYPLHEYAAECCDDRGCEKTAESILEDGLFDCVDCPIGIMYYLGVQAAENNALLMKYEDMVEAGSECDGMPK